MMVDSAIRAADPSIPWAPASYLADVTLAGRTDPDWIPEGTSVRSIAQSPIDNRAVVHLHDVEGGQQTLLLFDDEIAGECVFVSPIEAVHWSADGEWLVMQRASRPNSTGESGLSFVDPDTCTEVRVPLPDGTGLLAAVGR
jgi:hypothetical protein